MKINAIKKVAFATLLTGLVACNNIQVDKSSLETEVDSISYVLGLDMAVKIKANWDKADIAMYQQGFRNGMDSTNLLINPKDINAILSPFFQKLQNEKRQAQFEKMQAEAEIKFADVKKAGIDFLAANKLKKGVKTTASGLQYTVIKEGKGEKPNATSKVKVHYHGTNLDGSVFDSSVEKKKPYELGVNQFVKGFGEGLQLMTVGSKYKFFIPQELAYGATPRQGGPIKPFAALIFEVELLDILKK